MQSVCFTHMAQRVEVKRDSKDPCDPQVQAEMSHQSINDLHVEVRPWLRFSIYNII